MYTIQIKNKTQDTRLITHTQIRALTLKRMQQTTHKVTHVSYGNDARHPYGNDTRHDNRNRTHQSAPPTVQEEKVHKRIHHKYEELNLKLENPDLTDQERQKFKELIGKFGDVFVLSNMELEGTDILEYDIHVKQDARTMQQKPYNYSEKARAEIEKQVQELLAIKFIRRSTSA